MDAQAIDQIKLSFSSGSLVALNGVIGLMMFGMALDLKAADYCARLQNLLATEVFWR